MKEMDDMEMWDLRQAQLMMTVAAAHMASHAETDGEREAAAALDLQGAREIAHDLRAGWEESE